MLAWLAGLALHTGLPLRACWPGSVCFLFCSVICLFGILCSYMRSASMAVSSSACLQAYPGLLS